MYCTKCGYANPDDARFCNACGAPFGAGPAGLPPQALTRYAGFWRRFLALLLDNLLLGVAGFILGGILGVALAIVLTASGSVNLDAVQTSVMPLYWLLGLILSWLYFTLFESSPSRATLGKMALGIVVTDLQGNRISFGRANARFWGKILSSLILFVGFIMAGFTEKKQALHDLVAATLVARK